MEVSCILSRLLKCSKQFRELVLEKRQSKKADTTNTKKPEIEIEIMASAAVATATSTSSSSTAITMNETRPSTGSHSATANSGASEGGQTVETSEATHQQNQPQHHSQLQQQQHHESSRPAAAALESENGVSSKSETPLPADLRRILLEVAKIGSCSWLSWDQDGKELLHSEYAAAPVTAFTALHVGAASKAAAFGSASSLARQPFSTHRRSASSQYAAAVSQGPPRKKHRNGLHKGARRRFATADATAGGRKRPLFLTIRTNPNTQSNANANAAPGSVGSSAGRTSGSEPDDSTQYECDSEGTSATTNSEMSEERLLRKTQQRVNANALHTPSKIGSTTSIGDESSPSQHYKTLQEAFRVALGLVLDHFYRHCGGYKLSPAEKRRNKTLSASSNSSEKANDERRIPPLSSEGIFQQRRQKLLTMLLPGNPDDGLMRRKATNSEALPPFTAQRIAEVLLSPERVSMILPFLCLKWSMI